MRKALFIAAAILPMFVSAQDELVKNSRKTVAIAQNLNSNLLPQIDLERTSVKAQGSSGTCWSYATNSFLESEMIRMGKEPVEIAQIYSARRVYTEKADAYVRMHGAVAWGDGGSCHDVINMFAKYGAMPQTAYTGLNYGTTKNKFAEMQEVLKAMLDAWVKNPNGKLSPNWKQAFEAVMDTYLGKVPETFTWKGKSYTPKSFGEEVVGINPDNYVEISSFSDKPYYKKTTLMVPDNWSFDKVYNVKMNDLTDIIDYALSKGFTISWATDVSEKSFSWKNGVAYVAEKEYDDMSDDEKKEMFNGPKPERKITAEMRQQAYDNYSTTDDHGMHIVGTATDQNGREYYVVKNSWGTTNDYKGYLHVTKAFVQYKTTALLLHKRGVPPDVRAKLGME